MATLLTILFCLGQITQLSRAEIIFGNHSALQSATPLLTSYRLPLGVGDARVGTHGSITPSPDTQSCDNIRCPDGFHCVIWHDQIVCLKNGFTPCETFTTFGACADGSSCAQTQSGETICLPDGYFLCDPASVHGVTDGFCSNGNICCGNGCAPPGTQCCFQDSQGSSTAVSDILCLADQSCDINGVNNVDSYCANPPGMNCGCTRNPLDCMPSDSYKCCGTRFGQGATWCKVDQACGDGVCVDPQTPSTVGDFHSEGCYFDSGDARTLKNGSNEDFSTTGMTIEKCVKLADGWKYAGVEYSGQCFWGDILFGSKADSGDCKMPCSGKQTEVCGGNSRISLYTNPDWVNPTKKKLADALRDLGSIAIQIQSSVDTWRDLIKANTKRSGSSLTTILEQRAVVLGEQAAWVAQSRIVGTLFLTGANYETVSEAEHESAIELVNVVDGVFEEVATAAAADPATYGAIAEASAVSIGAPAVAGAVALGFFFLLGKLVSELDPFGGGEGGSGGSTTTTSLLSTTFSPTTTSTTTSSSSTTTAHSCILGCIPCAATEVALPAPTDDGSLVESRRNVRARNEKYSTIQKRRTGNICTKDVLVPNYESWHAAGGNAYTPFFNYEVLADTCPIIDWNLLQAPSGDPVPQPSYALVSYPPGSAQAYATEHIWEIQSINQFLRWMGENKFPDWWIPNPTEDSAYQAFCNFGPGGLLFTNTALTATYPAAGLTPMLDIVSALSGGPNSPLGELVYLKSSTNSMKGIYWGLNSYNIDNLSTIQGVILAITEITVVAQYMNHPLVSSIFQATNNRIREKFGNFGDAAAAYGTGVYSDFVPLDLRLIYDEWKEQYIDAIQNNMRNTVAAGLVKVQALITTQMANTPQGAYYDNLKYARDNIIPALASDKYSNSVIDLSVLK